tara:strand:- start:109 stop:318 length:210 start_codon:yes stop_codon:yes gene_type:complete
MSKIRNEMFNKNAVLVLRHLYQQGLDRLEDLSVTTPQTEELVKETEQISSGLEYINIQLDHFQNLDKYN